MTVTETKDGVEVEMLVSELVTEREVVGAIPTEIVQETTVTTTEFVSLATDDPDERFRNSIRNGANSARCSATTWREKDPGYFESCSAPEEEGGTGYIYIGQTTTIATSEDVTLTETQTVTRTISTLEPEETHTSDEPGGREEEKEVEQEQEQEEEQEEETDDGVLESYTDSTLSEEEEDQSGPSDAQAGGGILTLTSTFIEEPPQVTGADDVDEDSSGSACLADAGFWSFAAHICLMSSLAHFMWNG